MRIFLFARRYPVPYKTYYDAQFADLVARGHDVEIFAGGTHDNVVNEKVLRHRLLERTTYFPAALGAIPRRLPAILRGLFSSPAAALAQAGRVIGDGYGRRGVVHAARILSVIRDRPDLCLIHGLGTAEMMPWLGRVFDGAALAMYYHGGEVPTSSGIRGLQSAALFRAMDIVFTNTMFSRQHAIERGCPPEKIVILPVGFDLSDFSPPADRSYRRQGTLRLLSAGRMSEEKGFIFALQAINRLVRAGFRDIHYSLTGEGYLRPTLESYVRAEGLERHVTFLGTLTTEGVIRAMGEADALLLPSIQVGNWVENQACAVQEAMLMKALVITSITGGVPESIPPEMAAYNVTPGEVDALAQAIAAVHALPVSELKRLGAAGRAFVSSRYDIRSLNDFLIERTLGAARMRLQGRSSAEATSAVSPDQPGVAFRA
jgi:colanic acid/amylovoran biosynthesis glycosyltransferase